MSKKKVVVLAVAALTLIAIVATVGRRYIQVAMAGRNVPTLSTFGHPQTEEFKNSWHAGLTSLSLLNLPKKPKFDEIWNAVRRVPIGEVVLCNSEIGREFNFEVAWLDAYKNQIAGKHEQIKSEDINYIVNGKHLNYRFEVYEGKKINKGTIGLKTNDFVGAAMLEISIAPDDATDTAKRLVTIQQFANRVNEKAGESSACEWGGTLPIAIKPGETVKVPVRWTGRTL